MRTLGPYVFRRRRSVIWVEGSRIVPPKSLPGLGSVLSGGSEAVGGRRGGGPPHLDRLESILSNERGGPDFETRGKTMGPQIEERKVRASH